MKVGDLGERASGMVVGGGALAGAGGAGQKSFSQTLREALAEVNALQFEADRAAVKVATGEAVEFHEATIAMERAALALQLAIQVRNKVLEAYQEIMRLQI